MTNQQREPNPQASHEHRCVLAIDIEDNVICLYARPLTKRPKYSACWQGPLDDPKVRIKDGLPKWFYKMLERGQVRVVCEGGRDGDQYKRFVKWCEEAA